MKFFDTSGYIGLRPFSFTYRRPLFHPEEKLLAEIEKTLTEMSASWTQTHRRDRIDKLLIQ